MTGHRKRLKAKRRAKMERWRRIRRERNWQITVQAMEAADRGELKAWVDMEAVLETLRHEEGMGGLIAEVDRLKASEGLSTEKAFKRIKATRRKERGWEMKCVGGHDLCHTMLPSEDCPYCEPIL